MTTWNGGQLTKAREDRLWTRDNLALAWHKRYRRKLSLVSISNWERGVKPPGRNNLIKLAALFEKPVEYFFNNPQRKKTKQKKQKKRFGIF
jgi:transcriptional regulator with XRE-family HTH domain